MAAEPCVKCGKLRKIDIVFTSLGWLQPACFHCGDPGYFEPFEEESDGDNDTVLRDSES